MVTFHAYGVWVMKNTRKWTKVIGDFFSASTLIISASGTSHYGQKLATKTSFATLCHDIGHCAALDFGLSSLPPGARRWWSTVGTHVVILGLDLHWEEHEESVCYGSKLL